MNLGFVFFGTSRIVAQRSAVIAALSMLFSLLFVASPPAVLNAQAQSSCVASSEMTLASCIAQYNAASSGTTVTVTFVDDITLTTNLPSISNTATPRARLVLAGGGHTLDGDSATNGVVTNVLYQIDGDSEVRELTVTGATSSWVGLVVERGEVLVDRSTFAYNGYGITSTAELLVIRDSTIALNNKNGVVLWDADGEVQLQRSTLTYNGDGAVLVVAGAVSLEGSLIVWNGGSAKPECAGSGYTDLGGNVVQDATCGTTARPDAYLPARLEPYGCTEPCTDTVSPFPQSEAVDANRSCGSGLTDQRGVPRTAGKCDAGAVEIGDCASTTTVANGGELNFAIHCYNRVDTSGTVTIVVDAHITSLGTTTIDNRSAAEPTLHIDGRGQTIQTTEFAALGIVVDRGDLWLSNVTMRADFRGPTGLEVRPSASALVDGVTFTNHGSGIETGGDTIVTNSTFSGNNVGITVTMGGSVRVEQSTIVTNIDNGIVSTSGAVGLIGSLISGNGLFQCIGTGFVNIDGNVIEDATCGGSATPGVAGSFAGLFDNGCITSPCTRTVALIPGSPAVDAHTTCLVGTTDQRGEPRRPSKCDAGAFEFGDIAPVLCNGQEVTIDMTLGASGTGTAGDDVILGTAGDDVIDALAGNDTVCAGDGDDIVVGGDGDDVLLGAGGRDLMRGGPGIDRLDGGAGRDRLLGGIGGDTLNGGEGNDYLGGFGGNDTINGGPGDEVIFGGFGADVIDAGPGNDEVHGLVGNDTIRGGTGDDELDGDRGNDDVSGGDGNDVLRGGNASDVLRGDAGNDQVNGGKADDSLSGGSGIDVCTGNAQFVADTADASCETQFGIP